MKKLNLFPLFINAILFFLLSNPLINTMEGKVRPGDIIPTGSKIQESFESFKRRAEKFTQDVQEYKKYQQSTGFYIPFWTKKPEIKSFEQLKQQAEQLEQESYQLLSRIISVNPQFWGNLQYTANQVYITNFLDFLRNEKLIPEIE